MQCVTFDAAWFLTHADDVNDKDCFHGDLPGYPWV
jgi:hypothetical protein